MVFKYETDISREIISFVLEVTDLLPLFTTHAAVLPKLSNGADLMLPGVIPQGTGMNIYGHYKKGQLGKINFLIHLLTMVRKLF